MDKGTPKPGEGDQHYTGPTRGKIMSEEGETTAVHEEESSPLDEGPPTVEVKAAPMVEVPVEPEKEMPESSGSQFLFGLLLPIVVVLILTNTSLLSVGAWEFNRRVEVTLYSDDDGVFRFDADPKTSHGIEESVYIIFIDPSYTYYSQVYRPEIHIGVVEHCEVESVNAVCMYHLKYTEEGEAEVTKLGEYDRVNHAAEFVLNGEANESIVLRIDYTDLGAEQHYYEVEQPRNQALVFAIVPAGLIGLLGFAALTNRYSLAKGVGTSLVVIAGFVVLAVVSFIFELLSYVG